MKVTAQEEVIVKGKVLDTNSNEPLMFVQLIKNDSIGYHTNNTGDFQLTMKRSDNLEVSLMGYKKLQLSLPDSVSENILYIKILLERDTVELKEAVILPYKNYQDFKRAFINLGQNNEPETKIARNMEIINNQILNGVNPDMDAYSNYRNQFTYKYTQPQGFIFLSTDPKKGVWPLLKKAIGR